MIWLILGVALWWGSHLFKRLAPDARAGLGEKGKGLVALLTLLSVALMVIGYRGWTGPVLYAPAPGMTHVNNLLMLVAVLMVGAGSKGSWLAGKMRHPMLIGAVIWAVAHLLVNGDLASLVLFGGIGAWALLTMALIKRAEPGWTRSAGAPGRRDAVLVVVWLLVYGVIIWLHTLFGLNVVG